MISLRSEISRKVLGYFFLNETESLYVNEMARQFALNRGNLIRKLRELEHQRILLSEFRGNQRYYFLNKKHPLYREYKAIVLKTVGFEAKAKDLLAQIEGTEKAYIFGSYAEDGMDSGSDIDLLVIGSQDTIELQRKLRTLQNEFGREINATSICPAEFRKRSAEDPFLKNILSGPKIELI